MDKHEEKISHRRGFSNAGGGIADRKQPDKAGSRHPRLSVPMDGGQKPTLPFRTDGANHKRLNEPTQYQKPRKATHGR
jgi:hypothetical protein